MSLRAIPGPRGVPVLGNLGAYARDPLGCQTRWVAEHGDLVRYRLGGQEVVLACDPDAVREVLAAGSDRLVKGRALAAAKRVVGEGLLTSEGDDHLRARRMLAPIFQPKELARIADVMVRSATEQIAPWADGETRDVAQEMMELALRVIARVLFHREVDAEVERIGTALDDSLSVVARLTIPLYERLEPLPFPSHVRFRRAREYLDALVYGLIEERRQSGERPDDLLSRLLDAQDEEEDGGTLSDRQIRDEIMTLFLAGHETTANGLAWTFLLLAESPDAQARLEDELGGTIGARAPEYDDLARLPYLRAVVFESLRLRPPVWNVARRTVVPFTIGGHELPPGTVVIVSPWVSHHQTRWFEEPEAFRPERWLDEDPRRTHKGTYFPFGGGRRVCIGEHFALMEMQLLLATVVSRFRLDRADDRVIALQPTITIRPKGGVQMKLHLR